MIWNSARDILPKQGIWICTDPLNPWKTRTENWVQAVVFVCLLGLFVAPLSAGAADLSVPGAANWPDLLRLLPSPPRECRPLTRWIWGGTLPDEGEMRRQLGEIRELGLGGVELHVDPLIHPEQTAFRPSSPLLAALSSLASILSEMDLRLDLVIGEPGIDGTGFGDRLPFRFEKGFPADFVEREDRERPLVVFSRSLGSRRPGDWRLETEPIHEDFGREWLFVYGSEIAESTETEVSSTESFIQIFCEPFFEVLGDTLAGVSLGYLKSFPQVSARDFLAEFRERKGYDLLPHLYLYRETGPEAGAIRLDVRTFYSDLVTERFHEPFARRCRERGLGVRIASSEWVFYSNRISGSGGLPGNEFCSVPTRFGRTDSRLFSGASASRFHGVTGPGMTIGTSEGFLAARSSLERMGAAMGYAFLNGAGYSLVGSYPVSATEAISAPEPVLGDTNPASFAYRAPMEILARLTFLMNQGNRVADCLVVLPLADMLAAADEGEIHRILGELENLLEMITAGGYHFDLITEDLLLERATIAGGRLMIGSGDEYGALILPGLRRARKETLELAQALAGRGGKSLSWNQMPRYVPDFERFEERSLEVWNLGIRVFDGKSAHIIRNRFQLEFALREMRSPDCLVTPRDPDIGFLHRSFTDGDLYLFANGSYERRQRRVILRTGGIPQMLDLESGRPGPVSEWERSGDGIAATITFGPFESQVLFVSRRVTPSWGDAQTNLNGIRSVRAGNVLRVSGYTNGPGHYNVRFSGKTKSGPDDRTIERIPLSDHWRILAHGRISTVWSMDTLFSWTGVPGLEGHTGIVDYQTVFSVPTREFGNTHVAFLDFGDLHEGARVTLNGQAAGILWRRPYRIEVTELLKPGSNRLEVRIGAIPHWLSGSERYPDRRLAGILGPAILEIYPRVEYTFEVR